MLPIAIAVLVSKVLPRSVLEKKITRKRKRVTSAPVSKSQSKYTCFFFVFLYILIACLRTAKIARIPMLVSFDAKFTFNRSKSAGLKLKMVLRIYVVSCLLA